MICIVCGLLAAGFAYWYFLLRQPLAGRTSHDFGRVNMVQGETVELHHTFHLTNRTSKPIVISAIKPECGCLVVHAGPQTIERGQSVDLPITMTFKGASKTVPILLDLGEAGLQMLRVKADVRFQPRLYASAAELIINPAQTTSLILSADVYDTYSSPPPPVIHVPQGITATFEGWKSLFQAKNTKLAPCHWEGRLMLKQTAESVGADAAITIELKPAPPVTVRVQSRSTSAS